MITLSSSSLTTAINAYARRVQASPKSLGEPRGRIVGVGEHDSMDLLDKTVTRERRNKREFSRARRRGKA